MSRVPYYLGRPAGLWIAAMAKRGPARSAGRDRLAHDGNPVQPAPAPPAENADGI
jgi:hypothetical protein